MIIPVFQYGDIISRTGEDVRIVLSPAQQYVLQQLLSFLQLNPEQVLTDTDSYDLSDVNQFIDETMNSLLDDVIVDNIWQYGTTYLYPSQFDSITGTLQWVSLTTQAGAGYWSFSNNNQNNELLFNHVAFKKGTYNCTIYGIRENDKGIVNVLLASSLKTTVDMYNSTQILNGKVTSSSFTIDADGEYFVELKMATKNASSSAYGLRINWAKFQRLSD